MTSDDDLFGSAEVQGPDQPVVAAAPAERRRPVDRTALVAGLLFIAFGLAVLADDAGWGGFDLDMRWVWPLALIGLGLAGLLSGTRRADDRELP